jgi:hypothetical protein
MTGCNFKREPTTLSRGPSQVTLYILSFRLMTQPQTLTLLHKLIITLFRQIPPALPPLHNRQKRKNLRQPCKRRQNERILISHILNPGRNAISNRKTHRIPDNNNSNHSLTTQILVRINAIAHTKLHTDGIRSSDDAHGENESEPMDVVRGSYTPEDERARDEDEGCGEEPETVFGFQDAFVAAGEPEDLQVGEVSITQSRKVWSSGLYFSVSELPRRLKFFFFFFRNSE